MGYSINKLNEIYTQSYRGEPEFYAFVLYKNHNINFREYFLERYTNFDSNSPNVAFFVIDNPSAWFNNSRSSVNEVNKEEEIDVVLDYFGVNPSWLPAVITFDSLRSRSCNVFSLKNLENNSTRLDEFFGALFKPKSGSETYVKRCQFIKGTFHDIRMNIFIQKIIRV